MNTSSTKKNFLHGLLQRTTDAYDATQSRINRSADKFRSPLPDFKKPFNTGKDLPGVRRPVVADSRSSSPSLFPVVPPSERPVPLVTPQETMPSNKPSFHGLKVQTFPNRGKKLSLPTFGSIKR
jgi:hypothetical protein